MQIHNNDYGKNVGSIYLECFCQCQTIGDGREIRLSLANCAKARQNISREG